MKGEARGRDGTGEDIIIRPQSSSRLPLVLHPGCELRLTGAHRNERLFLEERLCPCGLPT